jgi:hypothetical protein
MALHKKSHLHFRKAVQKEIPFAKLKTWQTAGQTEFCTWVANEVQTEFLM